MPDDAGGPPTPVTVEECDELAPEMADGTAGNELPSCNLVLRTRCLHRYADLPGADRDPRHG